MATIFISKDFHGLRCLQTPGRLKSRDSPQCGTQPSFKRDENPDAVTSNWFFGFSAKKCCQYSVLECFVPSMCRLTILHDLEEQSSRDIFKLFKDFFELKRHHERFLISQCWRFNQIWVMATQICFMESSRKLGKIPVLTN